MGAGVVVTNNVEDNTDIAGLDFDKDSPKMGVDS